MNSVTEIVDRGDRIEKRFLFDHPDGERSHAAETHFYDRLGGEDLTPRVLEVGPHSIVLEKLVPLVDHVRKQTHASFGPALAAQIARMGEMGVAHRDVHTRNVVVTPAGLPVFIDFELAVECDPGATSYDLYGPERSGIEPPEIHQMLGVEVWWDGRTGDFPNLWRDFGALDQYC